MRAPWHYLSRDPIYQSLRRRMDWIDQIIMLASASGPYYNSRIAAPAYTEMLRVQSVMDRRRGQLVVEHAKREARERILVARGSLGPAA